RTRFSHHGHDVNLVSQAPEPRPQHLHHALKSTELAGRDHVHDHHVSPGIDVVSSARAALRVPSRMTTAAAKPCWCDRLTCAVRTPDSRACSTSAPNNRISGAPPGADTSSTCRS